jgi:hypothetical protein
VNLKYILGLGALLAGLVACSPETPKAYLSPVVPNEKVIEDNTQVFDPKVDILFVVDNSGSMEAHQTNLARNVAQFTSTFTKSSALDYNIGIVTTEMPDMWGSPSRVCCGQLVGSPRIVNKNTLGADQILARNFLVGTNGSSSEASFDPVVAALSSPLLNGWNVGFLRPDASLVVILMTDAEDQSTRTDALGLYNFLLNLKHKDASKILAYGVLAPTNNPQRCTRDEPFGSPLRIEKFLSMVQNNKNNIMSICDPDYGSRLATMAKDIVDKVGNIIYLSRPPDFSSIRVSYGSVDLPEDYHKGWSFDPKMNAILLGDQINWSSQPSGSRIKVFYNAAKFD